MIGQYDDICQILMLILDDFSSSKKSIIFSIKKKVAAKVPFKSINISNNFNERLFNYAITYNKIRFIINNENSGMNNHNNNVENTIITGRNNNE